MHPLTSFALASILALGSSLGIGSPPASRSPEDESQVPTVGEPAPPLSVEAPEGVDTEWSALRGKVVVLEFWATWCAPCIPALDHIDRLAKAFADQDVVFLGISPEEPERMELFLRTRRLAFPIALDRENATFDAFGVRVVPTTILIGRDGKIAARTRPEKLTRSVIERLIEDEPAGLEVIHDVASNIEWEPEDSPDGELFARLVIAPSESSSGGYRAQPGSGKISGDGMHRDNLIQIAYGVPHTRLVNALPRWSQEDPLFKLSVLAPGGDDELARRMLARSIEVKFQFEARYEERETDVFALAWDPDVRAWQASEASESEWKSSAYGGGVDYVAQPLASACAWFENIVQRPVVDETGLEGLYDLKMEWVNRDGFHAELARLGLELIAERRPIRFLVVEPRE